MANGLVEVRLIKNDQDNTLDNTGISVRKLQKKNAKDKFEFIVPNPTQNTRDYAESTDVYFSALKCPTP